MGVQRLVKPCRQLLESCGAKTKVLVWEVGGRPFRAGATDEPGDEARAEAA